MPHITIRSKDKILGDYQLQKGVSLTIGRREKNNVIIDDMAVSGHHAKIDSVGDGFVVFDLQSKNGSFVNEQLINSHWLKHGDTINVGEHLIVFEYSELEDLPSEERKKLEGTLILDTSQYRSKIRKSNPTRSISNVLGFWDSPPSRKQVKEKRPELPMGPTNIKKELHGTLQYLAGGKGEIYLTRKFTTIGKHPASDIVIKGLFMGQTSVTISKLPDGFHLCYVGGISKPKVNKQTIRKSTILSDEDIIAIGSVKMKFLNGIPTVPANSPTN